MYTVDKAVYKPLRRVIMGRSPIWFWLRRKISELGFSYAYYPGDNIITIYLYDDEHLNLKEVENCISWAYYKLLKG